MNFSNDRKILPEWFEENRVQAHVENRIELVVDGYSHVHRKVKDLGAQVLTRIVLNRDEGAWWPTSVGKTHKLAADRDLVAEIVADAHSVGLKVVGYHRHMSDWAMQTAKPDWICLHPNGTRVQEPRARRENYEVNVLCLNSPYRDYIKTRLLELADRKPDALYFDSWHMPEVCTCTYCRAAYRERFGENMSLDSGRSSVDFLKAVEFVSDTLLDTFSAWKTAVKERHPGTFFALGSSLHPCFHVQPHIGHSFLAISDTSKTEFSKPFGFNTKPAAELIEGFAEPRYDIQTATGWSLVRDSSGYRPPLMWIPFVRREGEALYSAAAAVTYGCIASMHMNFIDRDTGGPAGEENPGIFSSSFKLGAAVSPALAYSTPYEWAAIHVSERERNRHLDDTAAMWRAVFSPVLGAVEVLIENHLPWVTVNDAQLAGGLPSDTNVLIIPRSGNLDPTQQAAVNAFEAAGGAVIRMNMDEKWHLASEKSRLKSELRTQLDPTSKPGVRITGPTHMHATVFRNTEKGTVVICLANSWDWFRSEREPDADSPWDFGRAKPPSPCNSVSIEIDKAFHAAESVTSLYLAETKVARKPDSTVIRLSDFQIFAGVEIRDSAKISS